jgi:ADP-heptose:LPS heptosyltransferase
MPLLVALRALGLGDLLTAVPALRGLARAFPNHRRVLVAPRGLAPLLGLIRAEDGQPVVHELRHADLLNPATLARAKLPAALGAHAPAPPRTPSLDVAVNLHGRGPESHRALLGAQPRRLVAFAHPQVKELRTGPRWRAEEHEVGRWCRMLCESGIACNPAQLHIDPPAQSELQRSMRGATIIHPGASSAARRWPAERWAAVAAAERIVGRRVLITGARTEARLARRVARGAGLPPGAVLAGRTRVDELAGLVAVAGRVLCTDTGVGHLATALGTPSVLLFGPVSPAQWGPPAELERHVVLWAGSRGDPHAGSPDRGLLRLRVADVLDALERLPAGARASAGS